MGSMYLYSYTDRVLGHKYTSPHLLAEHIHMLQVSMSKMSLKILLGVFALICSASVGLSAKLPSCNQF